MFIFFALCAQVASLHSMVYDNRYFPLYPRTFTRTNLKPSNVIPDVIIFTGNSAYVNDDSSGGIPEIWGTYNQANLARAIQDLGSPNPLMSEFPEYVNSKLLWNMKGKLQGQGAALNYEQYVGRHTWLGVNFFAMHVFSSIEFSFNNASLELTTDQITALDNLRREMQASVGLQAPKFSKVGFSDIDFYIRCGNIWDYTRKFRRIDAGLRLGVLFPTGLTREINNPASVPFGGNGFWGIYGCVDLELELKEDWKVGVWGRMNKRFTRTKEIRLTLADEQPLFAVLPTPCNIDPGLTFIVSPYVLFEDLRDGLGIQGKYTLVVHDEDSIKYPTSTTPQPHIKPMTEATAWNAEYLTLNVFYDFAKVRVKMLCAPTFSFMWDIPVQVLLAERVSKTNRISLGVSFSF